MTNRYQKFMARLTAGEQLLIDGATGTEIEKRGVPMVKHGWNGSGALTDPDIVRAVHEDYIRAGAQVVISNTFSTSRHVLEGIDMADQFEFLNRRSVELVVEARRNMARPNVLAAGGITHWGFSGDPPPLGELRANTAEQVAIMADAGADLIMLEMMADIDQTSVMVEESLAAGLPVWVGFSCQPDEDGTMRLLSGPTLAEGLTAMQGHDIPLVSIMHTEVVDVDACLDVVDNVWNGLVGVYAHSGHFIDPNWIFEDTISPADYTAAALSWRRRGVQVIGGCCGIGLDHMRDLAANWPSPVS